jgi:acetyl-CoA carboxylase biotin carboxyl carrier protein
MEWEDVSKLVQLFKEEGLGELEYEDERFRIRLGSAKAVAVAPAPVAVAAHAPSSSAAPTPAAPAEKPGHLVTSPFVGTFYRQPAPDASPYVEVGQIVSRGQILCIIEAMKLMNEIEADANGRVAEILAQNGQAVEFGQPLFRIEAL